MNFSPLSLATFEKERHSALREGSIYILTLFISPPTDGADFNLDAVVLDFHGREVEAPFSPSVSLSITFLGNSSVNPTLIFIQKPHVVDANGFDRCTLSRDSCFSPRKPISVVLVPGRQDS